MPGLSTYGNRRARIMSIMNKQNLRGYILAEVKRSRPGWDCTQVSPSAMQVIEAKVKRMINGIVHQHPTRGKTFKEIL